ncbi:transporter substrate-binding domain-containing protein [Paraburkholderia fungorum]|nr:transporter substrate-binding domain-containing protein [Paraburkholderia fungorum]
MQLPIQSTQEGLTTMFDEFFNNAPDAAKPSRRSFLKTAGCGVLTGVGASLLGQSAWAASPASPIKTVRPGYLTAACLGDMPIASVRDGKLVGTDFEMLQLIAERLQLKIDVQQMSFSAVIEAVKSGRVDWFGGNFAWTPIRAKLLLLTNPVFYTGAYVIMRQGQTSKSSLTIADLSGHTIGTATGYSVVPDMKRVPGIVDVKLYDGSDSCLRDVVAGRLDFAVLDAPTVDYMIQQNPSWGLKQIPIAFDASYPSLTGKFASIWGVSPDKKDLFDGINEGISWLWRTNQIKPILAKYGITNPDYLVPLPTDPRLGVDRDAKGALIGPFAHESRDFSKAFA